MGKVSKHYMGKMGVVYMGNVNGEKNKGSCTRTEEEGLHSNSDPRGSRDARCQSQFTRSEPQRIHREDCQESNFFSTGAADVGGMFDQLIGDYRDQLAAKQEEKRRTEEETRRLEQEINHIESRLQEVELFRKQLKKESEDNT